MTYSNTHDEYGFTIIELLIATLIFSLILILCTTGLIQVSRTYYKGITASTTQSASRNLIDTISQNVQFSGGSIIPGLKSIAASPNVKGFCIDNNRYSYLEDKEQVGDTHVFLLDQMGSACDANTPVLDVNNPGLVTYTELMAPNTRLSKFSFTKVTDNLYQVQLRMIYGDDDVLNKVVGPNFHNQCDTSSIGTQFCSISDSTTVVQRRVQ
jgi:prepilin-type N-terminal cleavage/methylation domain-containing protein